MAENGYYPELGLHFEVNFSIPNSTGVDAFFQEVTGIGFSIEEKSHNGPNGDTLYLLDKVIYTALTLKRGVMRKNSPILLWFDLAVEQFKFALIDILVILKDENENPVIAWNFINAKPSKLSITGLNAMKGEILIEEMIFKYESFKRINQFKTSSDEDSMKKVRDLFK